MSDFLTRSEGKVKIKHRVSRTKFFIYPFLTILLALLGFYSYRIIFLKSFATQSKDQIYAQLEEARSALRNLDPAGAREPLATIDEEIKLVQTEANKYGVMNLAKLWNMISDKFNGVATILQNMAGISQAAIHINDDIAFLKENAANLMVSGHGPELINRLKQFESKLGQLTAFIDHIEQENKGLDEKTQTALANLRAEIYRNSDALTALINLLGSSTPHHLLVLFQNPTELRPAGGFIGSYAHIEIQNGNINNIEIRDIYDPDGQLDQKVIPPEELQVITKDWEARDANWFFDYPTSAKKVISFLNNSKIYQERKVSFTDAIAVNTNVLKDLVSLVGPIELPEYKRTITGENFLSEIQYEVEAGADKKVNQPKKILKVLGPMIIEKLTTLSDEGKKQLAKLLQQHLAERDIMLYFGDKELQKYVRSQGIAGDVLPVNKQAVSEYLAVVNANLAGGKSDAFVSQQIDFKSVISENGEIANTLTITRKHTGKKEKEWWYRATNKNFMQVYTPLGTRLTGAVGRSKWTPIPKRNYKDYTADTDVAAIESTRQYLSKLGIDREIINDKTVFSAWVSTLAGSSTKFVLEYKNPRKINPDSSIPYEFVFEKQSGASTTLAISISAPPKYKWKEVNSGVIEYQTEDPVGRIRIRQTLVPIAHTPF
jgi:hypothetical protein